VKNIDDVLEQRGEKYGEYRDLAALLDDILGVYARSKNWAALSSVMRTSLIMDAMKTVRILNGDPLEMDSWTDKKGYIQLVIRELEGERYDKQSASKHRRTD